jgi:DnaJ-class molecular chaperone
MNDKLPMPCQHCHASGLRAGVECRECAGKGYRLLVNGKEMAPRQDRAQQIQRPRPVQKQWRRSR